MNYPTLIYPKSHLAILILYHTPHLRVNLIHILRKTNLSLYFLCIVASEEQVSFVFLTFTIRIDYVVFVKFEIMNFWKKKKVEDNEGYEDEDVDEEEDETN